MSDLIDRQVLLEKKIRIPIARIVTEDKIIYRDVVFVKDIEDLPSAEPERMGKWIYPSANSVRPFGFDTVQCEKCGFFTVWDNNYNYCPNCGARMKEGDKE